MSDRERLDALVRHRQHYALVNALLRQGNDAGLEALGYDAGQIRKLKEPDAKGRIGYIAQAELARHKIMKLRKKIERTNGR